jgi:cation diffusion facilitator CzcD-associated flavoprotein CzcO/acetyl esterase/lipase
MTETKVAPASAPESNGMAGTPQYDVIVVGAGMAGLYLLHRLRGLGMTAVALEAADGVGGTWYWNRYPGARCDIQSLDYQFTFDPELEREWEWTEKYATQPEILRYLNHVADRYDLRRDIRFGTPVDRARWDEAASCWHVHTAGGDELTSRHYVMATGTLSVPKDPDIVGAHRFRGDTYLTGKWPHDGVDFTGKRVAVIGTGSSAIQSIPLIAEQAEQLTVFQRTPNFSMPAGNGPIPDSKQAEITENRDAYREAAKWSRAGVPMPKPTDSVFAVSEQERLRRFEEAWQAGELLAPSATFVDLGVNEAANELWCEFVRDKIRSTVDDPDVAEALCPTTYPFGTKRPCLDTNYYTTFNLPHVRLVDLRRQPIVTITETGIDIGSSGGVAADVESLEFDVIVYATGFDAMTGALVGVDIRGRDGLTLGEKWGHGPRTYLGLTTVGFPNLFMITGPGSPSVLSNMVVSIEQHVDWIMDALVSMRSNGFTTIEPTPTAEAGWVQHVDDCASITLFPKADSWYLGANVPGKPRVFLPYVGGVDTYRRTCDQVATQGYLGFRLTGPDGEQCNDGVVNQLHLDVMLLLDAMAQLDLPPLESLGPDGARRFMEMSSAMRPPGPDLGEIVDGTLPGAAGDLQYRLYRPPTDGPHPVVCYFHGGGWVLGSYDSDDPFCRYLALHSDSIVVSVDYRHAPEDRFPAAADDAFAALRWVAEHAEELGGSPGKLVVAGWSAGGNVAAVAAQRARDAGGPHLDGQLLVTPVTDGSIDRPSKYENADGYVLTKSVMDWFWDCYADAADRKDPLASPLLAASLTGLPPAAIFTAQFDPLRDEGTAYAEALAAAGVDVEHVACRGQIHTSLTAVGVIVSAETHRQQMAEAIKAFVA